VKLGVIVLPQRIHKEGTENHEVILSVKITYLESYIIYMPKSIKEYPKVFKAYSSNTILKRAIERDLEIIGEAVNRILKEDPEFPIDNAKKIISLRYHIIHSYDNISDENIWAIIQKHLPILKKQVDDLINNNK
jgi:uncharacterized protein with HEPN domain